MIKRQMALLLIAALMILLFSGCGSGSNTVVTAPVLTDRFTRISDSDFSGIYTFPTFSGLTNTVFQDELNAIFTGYTDPDCDRISQFKTECSQVLGDFGDGASQILGEGNEVGTYVLFCNDGRYLSFAVYFSQRLPGLDSETEIIAHIYNYDAVTGKPLDIAALFRSRSEIEDYIANELYERLLNAGSLMSGTYTDSVFKNDILSHCVVVSERKLAVITTIGSFDMFHSAGYPIIDMYIPEEYYIA